MKPHLILTTLILSTAFLVSTLASGQEATEGNGRTQAMAHKFEKARQYYGECKHTEAEQFDAIRPYLKAFTDVEVMTRIMSNPVEMTRLMNVVSDPRTVHVMMKCSTEPVMWDTWMRGMTDLNKLFRASLVFMNPMTYLNWMMAPLQPQVYSSLFGMLSPQNLGRWGIALTNTEFYKPLYDPLTSLNWYGPRINWIIDPQSYQPMLNMLTPGGGAETGTANEGQE